MEKRAYDTQPVRHEYLLTESGRDFYGVILAMADRLDETAEPPATED
ncbi:winged helix-turn-helix transcriptional regulator [Streptomyces antibioticus]